MICATNIYKSNSSGKLCIASVGNKFRSQLIILIEKLTKTVLFCFFVFF